MFKVYSLKSDIDGRLYVGMTKDINRRLREHNSGYVTSIKGYRPWRLIYTEDVGDRVEARKREKYLKSGCGKEFLKTINVPR